MHTDIQTYIKGINTLHELQARIAINPFREILIIKRKCQNVDFHDRYIYSGIKSFNEKVCVFMYIGM